MELPKEEEGGRMLLWPTSAHADRQAVAGLPDSTVENRMGHFRKIIFLGLCLPEKPKDGKMEKSRTLKIKV